MLIGLTAPAGSGKSKVSKRLRNRYGFKRMHAGKPVKTAMRAAFGMSKEAVDGPGKDAPHVDLGGVEPRAIMERVSEAVATHAPKATAIALRPRIMKALNAGRHVVVDGVRQKAEADLIHRLGGKLVAVDTGRMPDQAKPMDLKAAQLSPDHTIRARGGSPKELKRELRKATDSLMCSLMDCEM